MSHRSDGYNTTGLTSTFKTLYPVVDNFLTFFSRANISPSTSQCARKASRVFFWWAAPFESVQLRRHN